MFLLVIVFYVKPCHNSSSQNGRYLTDDLYKRIFMSEKFCIAIRISLKFVPTGPIDNNQASV